MDGGAARPKFADFKAELIAKEPVYKSVSAGDIRAKYRQDFPPVSRDAVVQTKSYETPVNLMGMMGPSQAFNGGGMLEISSTHIAIRSASGRSAAAKWGDIRELHDALATQGRFRVNFGPEPGRNSEKHIIVWITVDAGTALILAGMLKSLPDEARASRCATCFGPVVNDICKDCGESFRAGNRRGGMIKLVAGAALGLGGFLLTQVSHTGGTGGVAIAFTGMMGMGLFLIVAGLFSLVSGART